MPMCRVFSCIVGRGCLLWPARSLGKTLLAFGLFHSVLQGQICLLLRVFLDSLIFAFQSSIMKRTSFLPLKVACLHCVCSVTQSCPTLCDPMGCSPPGSSACGIFQARILERTAISSFRGSFQPRDWTQIPSFSCIGRQILYHCTTWEVCVSGTFS